MMFCSVVVLVFGPALVLRLSFTKLLKKLFLRRTCVCGGVFVLLMAQSAAGLAPLILSPARHQ
jgi:hypothetical protein